jgi:iron complex outermembrane receptor protein
VVSNTSQGTTTDADGNYTLKLSAPGSYKIVFSAIGFVSVSNDVSLAAGETKTLDITMAEDDVKLDEIVVSVGSRNNQRTLTDTPLPIDILSNKELSSTGQSTFDKALQYRVPSFNTVQTPVNDATSLLDPYEIRNMGPSRTLILINGKRKNMSSLVYIQTSPGRGETGADISAIPTDAVKRVEVLRDGASAQYGSDAIAGVMNIILKDKYEYGSVVLNGGVTHKGDGGLLGISINNGTNFGSKGFLNYTINFQQQDLANRPGKVDSGTDAIDNEGRPLAGGEYADFGYTDIDNPDNYPGGVITPQEKAILIQRNSTSRTFIDNFLAKKPDAGNINGSPKTTSAKFLVNGGLPVGDFSEIYFNAAYVYKKVNSFANYRTPYWRTLADYPFLANFFAGGNPANYVGYVPTFDGDLNDFNGTIGFKSTKNGWTTDLSFTTGGNKQIYTVTNSVNRDLGLSSPLVFRPGGYSFFHNVGNIDISKQLNEKISFAFGSEFRTETFNIFEGDTASYSGGGADSFSGLGPSNALKANRYNLGAYVDFGFDLTEDFLLNATARMENYSDFGNAFVWKLSSRYKFAEDKVTLRTSISTGFRAPTLHQIYANTTKYGFVPGEGIQVSGFVNNTSPAARFLGVPQLKAEKSVNFTAGLGVNPTKNLSFTLDYYNIRVNDRILLSSEIGPTDAGNTDLDDVLADNNIVSVSFFVNGIDTRTSGLDLVANYRKLALGSGTMNFNLAGNWMISNEIVDGLNGGVKNPALIANAGKSVFDATQEALMLSSRPKFKAIFGIDYQVSKWFFSLNNTLFGPTSFRQAGLNSNLKTEFTTRVVTDLAIGYEFSKKINFTANINNIFNVLPKWKFVALNQEGSQVLSDPNQVRLNSNLITFNQRYNLVTYDGSHFSQLGTIFNGRLEFRF